MGSPADDVKALVPEQAQLTALLDLVKRIAALTPPERLLELIADAAARLFGFESGSFRLLEDDELVAAGHWGDEAMRRPRIRVGESLSGRVAQSGEILVVHDVQEDPRLDPLHREAARRFGYQTYAGVPLRLGSRVLGVLVLRSRHRRELPPGDLAVLRAFADHAAIAIQNARLYETAQRQRRQAEALTEIARDVSGALDRDTLLQRVVEHARRLCQADVVSLALAEGDGSEAAVVAQAGYATDAYRRVRFRPGEGLVGEVLATRRSVSTPDRVADTRWPAGELARAEELRAVAAVPVLAGEALLGVLLVHRRAPDPFGPTEVATVEALARHAAVAIQNTSLYEASRAQAAEVQVLRSIGLDLARSRELPEVLQSIVDAARQHTRSDGAFCAVVDPSTLEVATVASAGARSKAFSRYRLAPGQGIGGWFLVHKRPFRTEDYLADPRFSHAFDDDARAEGVVANLGVPILHDDQVTGLLWVFNRTQRPFSERDEAFLSGLADHAAAAIENTRVHAERQRALEELRASQDRLVQTERLRALGEMASGVAHDFNNLLAVVLGRAQLLKLRYEDPKLRQGLSVIESAALDAAQRVRRIQEFTRIRQARPYGLVDLAQAIHEAVELTRGRWHDEAQVRGVTYTIELDLPDVPPVVGDPGDLREVFTSLLLNALDAMPESGRIAISLAAGPGQVVARVRDTGPGIPRDLQHRIFEPFFTTRGPRQHGLGLSVAYGIVQRHRGTIEVEAGDAHGTTFAVTLPVAGIATGAEQAEVPSSAAGRPARVFVVEDEALVREVLVDLLRSAGHQPVAAGDGLSGLALLEQGSRPDVALVDLGLPGISGLEVAARLRASYPGIPVILVTGWADRLDPVTAEQSGVSRVIAKPFQAEEVLRAVAEATRRTPAP